MVIEHMHYFETISFVMSVYLSVNFFEVVLMALEITEINT